MNILVVCVHGTWARGARWPLLEQAIRDRLSSLHIEFEYFSWSGRNSLRAREAAARDLRKRLQEITTAPSPPEVFVIGHSHGGTVALLAAGGRGIPIRGVLTLATPFFAVRARPIPPALSHPGLLGILALYTAPIWMFFVIGEPGSRGLWREALIAVTLIAFSCLGIWASKGSATHFPMRTRISRRSSVDYLILRTPADETSLALTTLQTLEVIVTRFWMLFGGDSEMRALRRAQDRVADRLTPQGRKIAKGALVIEGVAFAIFAVPSLLSAFNLNLFIQLVGTETILAALYVASPLLVIVLLYLTLVWVRIAAFVFALIVLMPLAIIAAAVRVFLGAEYALRVLACEVSVEATPAGAWAIHQMDYPSILGLHHSAAYKDPDTCVVLARWIDRHTAQYAKAGATP